MSDYALRENIAANEAGRIETANEQNRRLNGWAWMSKPKASAAANSANLKAALADSISGGLGRTLLLRPGDYLLNDYFPINDVRGLNVIGMGGATRLIWTQNDPLHAMFELSDVRESCFRRLMFHFNNYSAAAFVTRNKPGGTTTPSMNLFEDISIECVSKAAYGIMIGGLGNTDRNNDFHVLRRFYAIAYTTAGVHLRGEGNATQSYSNLLEQCYLFGGTGAEYGINAGGNYCGHFRMDGGFIGGHTKADFLIGRSYQPYSILGVNGEVSARFIESDAAHNHIHVEDCRVAANAIHDDGRMIITRGRVKLRLIGNRFGDGVRRVEDENGVLQKIPVVFDFSAANGARVRCMDNEVYSVADQVFVGAVPYVLEGNDRIPDEATGLSVPLTA